MTVVTLPRPGASLLTNADRHLIAMLADGYPYKRIGPLIGIHPASVGNRVMSLVRRTGTENPRHLVATALRCGWLDDDAASRAAA